MADQVINQVLTAAGSGVALFSKSYCPYCRRAKDALHSVGINPVVVELNERQDGRDIQVKLLQMTGQRTVPSAWLNGKHIGGSDDVVAGVQSGLFKEIKAGEVKQHVEEKHGMKKCGAGDGIPCLCTSDAC